MLRKSTKRLAAAVSAAALLSLAACVPALAAGKSPHHVVTAFDPATGRAELELYLPVVEEYCYEVIEISGWTDGAEPGPASFEIRYADGTVSDADAGSPDVGDADKTWSWRMPATDRPCLSVRFAYEIKRLGPDVGELDAVVGTVPGDAVSSVGPLRAYVPRDVNGARQDPDRAAVAAMADVAMAMLCAVLAAAAIVVCAVASRTARRNGQNRYHAAKTGRRTERRRHGAGRLK